MKKIVRIVCLIVAFLVCFMFTACYVPSEEFEKVNPGTLPDPIPGKDYAALGLERYENEVTIKVASINYPLESNIKPGTTCLTQTFNKMAKDVLNIKLEYVVVAQSANYDTQLNLAISAKRMPDMFYTTDANLFGSLRKNGQLADLGDVFYYLNDELREVYLETMPELLPNVMTEGKLYAFPMAANKYEAAQRLYVRKDWLDILGLNAPRTTADMIAIGEAFYNNASLFRNANGTPLTQSSIVPLTMHKDITWAGSMGSAGMFNIFGAQPTAYFEGEDEKLYSGTTSDGAKDAVAFLRELYSKKILDQQFISKNVDMVSDDIKSGKVGMVFGEWWMPADQLGVTVEKVQGAEWIAVDLPTHYDGQPATPVVKKVNLTGYNVVSKDCAHPEAAAKLINLFYDIYYNDRAEEIYGSGVKPENGFYYNMVPIKLWNSAASILEYKRVKQVFDDAYNAGAREGWKVLSESEYAGLSDTGRAAYDEQFAAYDRLRTREKKLHWDKGYAYFCALKAGIPIKDMTAAQRAGWGIYECMVSEGGGYAYVTDLTEGRKSAKYDMFYGTPTPLMISKGDAMNTFSAVSFTAMITGDEDMSYWNTFVNDYNQMGGDSVINQVNKWYASQWKGNE
ncbi:MAG: extracellular solute-binding protein [Clostridia bacterium]|nr:extracellular solute-binding protein [Clostridia bacterium]